MGIISVLGLGPSKDLFKPEGFNKIIGVNDIWRFYKTDVIVCLDREKAFTSERLKVINESKPEAFYSQVVNWDKRDDFIKINISPGYPEKICILDRNLMAKSYCSPFVACQVAFWYYEAIEIHLYGIDMINHPHLNGTLCSKIKTHFKNLAAALEEKGCKMIVHGKGILTKHFT